MFLNRITLALLSCLFMLYLPLSTLFMSHLSSYTHISTSLHSESPYFQPSPPPTPLHSTHFMILFLGFSFELLQILLDQLIGFLSLIFFTPKFTNSLDKISWTNGVKHLLSLIDTISNLCFGSKKHFFLETLKINTTLHKEGCFYLRRYF